MNSLFTQLLIGVFRNWIEHLAAVLRQAQDAGELKALIHPEVLAKHVVANIEGGLMMSRLDKDGDHLTDCLTFETRP